MLLDNSSLIISIHAPTRGATLFVYRDEYMVLFQSTLLQEERLDGLEKALTIAEISIHAPTRGATLTDMNDSYDL